MKKHNILKVNIILAALIALPLLFAFTPEPHTVTSAVTVPDSTGWIDSGTVDINDMYYITVTFEGVLYQDDTLTSSPFSLAGNDGEIVMAKYLGFADSAAVTCLILGSWFPGQYDSLTTIYSTDSTKTQNIVRDTLNYSAYNYKLLLYGESVNGDSTYFKNVLRAKRN